jgi:exopolysaccharide biosynthesis protein
MIAGVAVLGVLLAATQSIPWRTVHPGIEQADFPAGRRGALAKVNVVVVRLDPTQVTLSLAARSRDEGLRGAWTIDSLAEEALAAFNGGQFVGGAPWGWSVRNGVELQSPGHGPLAMAVTVDAIGRVALLTPDEIPASRGHVREAMQSYPTLLVGGALPEPLRAAGRGVDIGHRDARLAIGVDGHGRILVALTRFVGVAGHGSSFPYGPTLPEMAALMRRLGAVRAVGLDGGLSSQLAVRKRDGSLTRHPNWRMVPVGVEVRALSGQR